MTKLRKNCNSCLHAEENPSCILYSGPNKGKAHEIECMSPMLDENENDDHPLQVWIDENLHEGWCLKSADGCPGYEAETTP